MFAVVFEIHWKIHVASTLESRIRVIHQDMRKAFVAFKEEMWFIFVDKASQDVSVVCFHRFTLNVCCSV